ncbi:NAD-dependent epimerase/dehydratase family protein [Verminephrobacter aporrectodeae subsp. tuberculatae]|uniref:NAD-dependent epimerase/dehydratase family protein n=1 Tax=Verminephrobacter aporrectodeae TaxID=1110389 RepID=UPI002244341C|nr:NAD-dependent epimerase/dehydratase family protein [Verminephrobacter aporrectodeae]MCW8209068.1 NAD-dependent epimerase/dehydratase family protein [Verminephrobacter aporrectodeae subsp. tuberculatae]
MPSNQSPLGALPARFRRERLLIVGCGDVGQRVLRDLHGGPGAGRMQLLALSSSPFRVAQLRALGARPLRGDLDDVASLRRLSGLATRVLHLAPPPGAVDGGDARDPRTLALTRVLRLRSLPRSLVYASTSGVYGDCAGARVPETRALAPATARAQRRAHAERAVRHLGRAGVRVGILRVPGIYAPDRARGRAEDRLRRGVPVPLPGDDVFTSHIHADDLARVCVAALWRGRPQRAYNAGDSNPMKTGDYFDLVADRYGLPRPPRVPRSALQPTLRSFIGESRRLDNRRMLRELGVRLRYPGVQQGLRGLSALSAGSACPVCRSSGTHCSS